MSLLHAIWLECDKCGQASTDLLGYDTEELARATAERNGWRNMSNQGGERYDLCPSCFYDQQANITIQI